MDGLCLKDRHLTPIDEIGMCPDDSPKEMSIPIPKLKPFEKKDMGRWVVVQPNGLLSYYDEQTRTIIAKDMTPEDLAGFRSSIYRMPYDETLEDTRRQMQFRPIRWEDIK